LAEKWQIVKKYQVDQEIRNVLFINCLRMVIAELCSIFATLSFTINLRLIFRVPSQYKHLRLTQRVTCLQKTRKLQRYIKEKGTV
jgi:hypothetical protein